VSSSAKPKTETTRWGRGLADEGRNGGAQLSQSPGLLLIRERFAFERDGIGGMDPEKISVRLRTCSHGISLGSLPPPARSSGDHHNQHSSQEYHRSLSMLSNELNKKKGITGLIGRPGWSIISASTSGWFTRSAGFVCLGIQETSPYSNHRTAAFFPNTLIT
jgi:hypothetical protein